MKLYHASDCKVETPDTSHSREQLDFGKGFYLTSMREQAVNYGARFTRRKKDALLNSYEFIENLSEYKVKVFPAYDEEWLDFVSANRNGTPVEYFDLIIGGIANDKVVRTLEFYWNGDYDREKTLGLLKYERPNIQYCIRSGKMLKECLTFLECIKL